MEYKEITADKYNKLPSKAEAFLVVYRNGRKEWHVNGTLHRTDGPAIEDVDESGTWYLNGIKRSYNQWRTEKKQCMQDDLNEKIRDQII